MYSRLERQKVQQSLKFQDETDLLYLEDDRFKPLGQRYFFTRLFCGCAPATRCCIWGTIIFLSAFLFVALIVTGAIVAYDEPTVAPNADPCIGDSNYTCMSIQIRHHCELPKGTAPCLSGLPHPELEIMPVNLTVAMFADSALSPNASDVFRLAVTEGAEVIIHSGDYDYTNNPEAWDALVNSTLGPNFPYFAAIGNHDLQSWYAAGGYQERMYNRLLRSGHLDRCKGDLGVNSVCSYKGLVFTLSGVGTLVGNTDEAFLHAAFGIFGGVWRIAAWHQNQHLMQLGTKADTTGWQIYENAKHAGAIIATGHEHSFARSKPMTDIQNQIYVNETSNFTIGQDKTYVQVCGTGGQPVRPCADNAQFNPWWATALCNNVSEM